MKNDRAKLSANELAQIRRLAVERVFAGERACDVTKDYGLSSKVIFKWLKKAKKEGLDSLAPLPRLGRSRKLSYDQEEEIKRWLLESDPREGFALWNRLSIAKLLEEKFGARLSVSSTGRLLRRNGLAPEKPLRQAYKRDKQAIFSWSKENYSDLKKYAKKVSAEVFWLNEVSISIDVSSHGKGFQKGGMSVASANGDSINAVSLLSNKGGFLYYTFAGKLTADKCVDCISFFVKHGIGRAILIVGGHPVYKSKKVLDFIESLDHKIEIVFLPSHAPDMHLAELF